MTEQTEAKTDGFFECVEMCASRPEFVSEFNRLTGRKLGENLVPSSPIAKMVDEATGFDEARDTQQREDSRAFIEFCFEYVWAPFVQNSQGAVD